jgi:hypothetical protein
MRLYDKKRIVDVFEGSLEKRKRKSLLLMNLAKKITIYE